MRYYISFHYTGTIGDGTIAHGDEEVYDPVKCANLIFNNDPQARGIASRNADCFTSATFAICESSPAPPMG